MSTRGSKHAERREILRKLWLDMREERLDWPEFNERAGVLLDLVREQTTNDLMEALRVGTPRDTFPRQ